MNVEPLQPEIRRLGAEYRGRRLDFVYRTSARYELDMREDPDGWSFRWKLAPLGRQECKRFSDTLLSGWLEKPFLFGAFVDGREAGFLELSHETWNNRFRIANILVLEAYRRRGIGALLFSEAEKQAREAGARAIVLETQSCNVPAIQFYRKMGMTLCGFDLLAYSNADAEKGEIRLEMAKRLA